MGGSCWAPRAARGTGRGQSHWHTTHLSVLAKSLLDFARSLDRLDSARSIGNAAALLLEELKGAETSLQTGRADACWLP